MNTFDLKDCVDQALADFNQSLAGLIKGTDEAGARTLAVKFKSRLEELTEGMSEVERMNFFTAVSARLITAAPGDMIEDLSKGENLRPELKDAMARVAEFNKRYNEELDRIASEKIPWAEAEKALTALVTKAVEGLEQPHRGLVELVILQEMQYLKKHGPDSRLGEVNMEWMQQGKCPVHGDACPDDSPSESTFTFDSKEEPTVMPRFKFN